MVHIIFFNTTAYFITSPSRNIFPFKIILLELTDYMQIVESRLPVVHTIYNLSAISFNFSDIDVTSSILDVISSVAAACS